MTKHVSVLPFYPLGFVPAGEILWARLLPSNVEPFRNLRAGGNFSRAQRAGKKYEERVLRNLLGTFNSLEISRWLQFDGQGKTRFCQPDAFLFDENAKRLTIFEIKLSHTVLAKFQLRDLYAPVLAHILKPKEIRLVEIVRHWNAGDPEGPLYLDFAEFVDSTPTSGIEVLRWKL